MNRPTIDELIKSKFNELPDTTKVLFDHPDTIKLIEQVSEKYNLASFETDKLIIEIGYVLFGITKVNDFSRIIEDEIILDPESSKEISELCNKIIFNKMKGSSESLNHIDILNEIENPTPSIVAQPATPQPTPAVTEEPKKPTLEEALSGVLPSTGGFTFEEAKHPAEPMSQKLDQKLTESTSSTPKEIYVVKKIDPYHEPLE